MKKERFRCGYPEGIESLMAGKIKYGQRFEDVWEQIGLLSKKQRDQLVLLVACDRIYGFFEQRGGVANGPRLEQFIRSLLSSREVPTAVGTTWRSISVSSRAKRSEAEGSPHEGDRDLHSSRDDNRDTGLLRLGYETRNDEGVLTQKEAKYYFDEMVKTGILGIVEDLGSKNVFCSVWNYINESLGY